MTTNKSLNSLLRILIAALIGWAARVGQYGFAVTLFTLVILQALEWPESAINSSKPEGRNADTTTKH